VAEARRALALIDVVFTGRVLRTGYGRDSTVSLTMDGNSVWFRSNTLVATMAVGTVWKGEIRTLCGLRPTSRPRPAAPACGPVTAISSPPRWSITRLLPVSAVGPDHCRGLPGSRRSFSVQHPERQATLIGRPVRGGQ